MKLVGPYNSAQSSVGLQGNFSVTEKVNTAGYPYVEVAYMNLRMLIFTQTKTIQILKISRKEHRDIDELLITLTGT